MNKALEQKILRTYKNWGIYRTASICKVKREEVRETLKKNGIEERKRGWMWREQDLYLGKTR